MENKKKTGAKILTLLLAFILCFALAGMFFGCGDETKTPPIEFTPPAQTPKVHSVAITYNDENIEGLLSVDISQRTIKIGAVVSKDDDAAGALTYKSSAEAVATVDNEGNVMLLSAGETVLTAAYGDEKCSVVLAVESGYTGKYSVTVNGGRADLSSAAAGDIVTITPVIPEHKDFSEWSYADSATPVTWVSGNMFKMPAGNVTVKAVYVDKLYSLKLVGAKVTSDGNDEVKKGTVIGYDGSQTDEYAITEYKYPYETKLSLAAVEPLSGRMFVGWDENIVNNRLDKEETIGDFIMPDESTTFWANFSDIKERKLLTAGGINNWETTVIDGTSADPELEGFSGYTVTIPAGKVGTPTGYNEDIHGSVLNTVTNNSQSIRAIFRNRGDKPVTVEIYASYLTNLATSGWVTVPAGETVTKTFIALLGFRANPWWGFSLRETVGPGADVPLDIVVGCGDAYPKGDKTLAVTGGTKRVALENYKRIMGALSPNLNNNYSWTFIADYEHSNADLPAVISARLKNLPAYDENDPYVTIYIKMLNQASSDHTYHYRFGFGKDENPLDEDNNVRPDTKIVDFTVANHGETKLFAIRIPRSQSDENFYFSIIKLEYDTEDGTKPESVAPYYALNFSVVLTYNNGMGFDGEVTE